MSDYPLVEDKPITAEQAPIGACHRELIELIDDQSHCRCTPNPDGTYDSTNCYVSQEWYLTMELS
jgi:hypothetical protein